MHKFIIVIPVYKANFTTNELLVMNNLIELYGYTKLIFACPNSLNLKSKFNQIKKIRFEDSFFKDISSYNKLMLSLDFYQAFVDYDYILIHQLDAYIFKDEIQQWCKKDYDYIGSPWLSNHNKLLSLFYSKRKTKRIPIFNKVGNGGFSLRKTKTFIDFAQHHHDVIKQYENHKLYGIEDVFWSIIATKYKEFKIPDVNTAAKFALDRKPSMGMKMNSFDLPFGCHGIEKAKTKNFWKQHIKGLT